MKFTVDRRTWHRGQDGNSSFLLDGNGMRCCIGHVGKQCGIPDEVLLFKRTVLVSPMSRPSEADPRWPRWMLYGKGVAALWKAYEVNDLCFKDDEQQEELKDEEREQQLKAIFADNGDELEFVN